MLGGRLVGLFSSSVGEGRGQGRESHVSQPPAGSVDQLQGCSLSGAVRRWKEERKREKKGKGRNLDERERERSVVVPEEEARMTQA